MTNQYKKRRIFGYSRILREMKMIDIDSAVRAMKEDVLLMESMWRDPLVQMYQDMDLPDDDTIKNHGGIFLAGPTSRNQLIEMNWRKEAVRLLRDFGFRGWIYVPENRGGYGKEWNRNLSGEFDAPEWETKRLWEHPATRAKVFWIPRDDHELFGLNTNWEAGYACGVIVQGAPVEEIFIGWPEKANRMKLPKHYLELIEAKGWNPKHNSADSLHQLCFKTWRYLQISQI